MQHLNFKPLKNNSSKSQVGELGILNGLDSQLYLFLTRIKLIIKMLFELSLEFPFQS